MSVVVVSFVSGLDRMKRSACSASLDSDLDSNGRIAVSRERAN